MTWLKLHPRFFQATSMITLSRRARWTYVASLCYASSYGTFVPKGALGLFDGGPAEAKELVAAGLWGEADGGWEMVETGLFKFPHPQNQDLPRLRATWSGMRVRVTPLVFARDGYACVACGAGTPPEVDHIVPLATGGSNEMANLQTLCGPCNRRKGVRPWPEPAS